MFVIKGTNLIRKCETNPKSFQGQTQFNIINLTLATAILLVMLMQQSQVRK
jgi:hypothetical protein